MIIDMDFCKYERDFLWFTYFGITIEDAKDDNIALKACVNRAYLDMCRTIRTYIYKATELEKESDKNDPLKDSFIKARQAFLKDITVIIQNKMKDLVNNPNDFNSNHKNLCDAIILKANVCYGNKLFKKKEDSSIDGLTYGQAQKWLNMTFKYMLIMNIYQIRKIVEFLHIPIDKYILKELYYNYKKVDYNGFSIVESGKKSPEYYIVDNQSNKYKWSAIPTYMFYDDFRNGIEGCIGNKPPIVWEKDAWLKQAKADKTESDE